MQKALKEITDIQAGFSFRGSIPVSKNGNYRVIQIKDISPDGFIRKDNLVRTEIDFIKPEYLTYENDVLFTSRGLNRRAAIVDKESENAIFVSQLYALKIKTEDILPEYLAWYINQKPAEEFFEANASASYIQNIRQDVLGRLPVFLPSVETQRKIIEMHQLSLREKEIMERVLAKRQQIMNQLLLKLIQGKLQF